jgi:hypothetical protein
MPLSSTIMCTPGLPEAVLEVDGKSEILNKELPRLRDIEHT